MRRCCALVLLLCASSAWAEFITVYSTPTYTPGVGGLQEGGAARVNDAGTAVGSARKYDSSGTNKGSRALRWDASGTTELGHLGTDSSGFTDAGASDINSTGTVVGSAEKFAGSGADLGARAVRWDASRTSAIELGNIGTDPSGFTLVYANLINSAGTAVGTAYKFDGSNLVGSRAVRWEASGTAATELGNLGTKSWGYTYTDVSDINSAGTAVGSAFKFDSSGADKGSRAVRWEASGTAATELGNLGTDSRGSTGAFAHAINSAGTIVGTAQKNDGTDAYLGYRAVRWDASGTTATELGNLGTGAGSGIDPPSAGSITMAAALAINTAGTAVGYADKYDASGTELGERAVRWDASGTAATELGSLGTSLSGGAQAYAYAINDAGFAVGYATKYDSVGTYRGLRAVYWGPDNLAVDLNTLIDPASGWTLEHAGVITDTGWIAGDGHFDPDGPGGQAAYTRGFSMQIPATAIPEPASAALLAFAAARLLRRRKRSA